MSEGAAEDTDLTNLAYWFPRVEAAGLPVPATRIVHTAADILTILDGELPEGDWLDLLAEIRSAAETIPGPPWFLRTGHTSGKHEWEDTCLLPDLLLSTLGQHAYRLVEYSAMADLFGLPVQTWVVREMIDTAPLFRCQSYGDFPVTREFRAFVRYDAVEAIYPYWPAEAIQQGDPDTEDWADRLAAAAVLEGEDLGLVTVYASRAGAALGDGYWSADFLQDRDGRWWLTDMAEGDKSWRPETPTEGT